MSLLALAVRDVTRSPFRSWVVFLCALLVAGLTLSMVLVLRGAQNSLRLATERLGADILVVPEQAAGAVESALLMGRPDDAYMPAAALAQIAAVEGIETASPQLYMASLEDAACCSLSNLFIVAYDPATDFTLSPWLERRLGSGLRPGEVVGGTYVFVPPDEERIELYGYPLDLVANLEPTGTNLDNSVFMTFETARLMAAASVTSAEETLDPPGERISAVLVKLEPGADAEEVALDIPHQVAGVTAIESPDLFSAFRGQMKGLFRSLLLLLAIVLALSVMLVGAVFSLATHDRRREIGVLRALGATRRRVLGTFLIQAGLLGLAGALLGMLLAALALFLFRDLLVESLGLPFTLPSLPALGGMILAGLGVALAGVVLAALVPAARAARMDPALAMRD